MKLVSREQQKPLNMPTSVALTLLSTLLFSITTAAPAEAQFSYRRTIGDETENQYQPGFSQAIKYRGNLISNPSLSRNNGNAGNFTRHTRLGESTGIGGSTLQTTSVTSESRPALSRPLSADSGTALITRPNLQVHFQSAFDSPALRVFDVRRPDTADEPDFGRRPESFTTSTSPLLHSLPSFSSPVNEFEFGQ